MKRIILLAAALILNGCTDYSDETKKLETFCQRTKEPICKAVVENAAAYSIFKHFGQDAIDVPQAAKCRPLPVIYVLSCLKELHKDNTDLGIIELAEKDLATVLGKKPATTDSKFSVPVDSVVVGETPAAERVKGQKIATVEGEKFTYTLARINPKESPYVFELMASKPTGTAEHPSNENPAFKDAKVTSKPGVSPLSAKTSLVIDDTTILTASTYDEGFQIDSVSSIQGQDELLLVNTFAGGNSCESSNQRVVARSNTEFSVSHEFGRCGFSWWQDESRHITYFVYPANEYNAQEVIAITRAARQSH